MRFKKLFKEVDEAVNVSKGRTMKLFTRRIFHVTGVALAALMLGSGPLIAAERTRVMSYDYSVSNGVLSKEIVEPFGASKRCLVSVLTYDDYGNRLLQQVRNCNGSSGVYPGSSVTTNKEAASLPAADAALIATRYTVQTFTYNADGTITLDGANAEGEEKRTLISGIHGQPLSVTEFVNTSGLLTQFEYDFLGRKTLEKRPDGNGTKWAYDHCTGVEGVVTTVCASVGAVMPTYVVTETPINLTSLQPNGRYTKTYYDTLDRVLRTETQGFDGRLIYSDVRYDAQGRTQAKSAPYFQNDASYWTTYSYDKLDRVLAVQAPDASSTMTAHNGLSTTVTDALSHTTTKTKNVIGKVVTVRDARNVDMQLSYDPLGNLEQSKDSLGNLVKIQYDALSRKIAMQDPDLGSWTYDYNAAGDLVTQTDAKSLITKMFYDRVGRVTRREEPNLTSRWYYSVLANGNPCSHGKSKLCQVTTTGGFNRQYMYNALGQSIAWINRLDSQVYVTAFDYDANGRLQYLWYPKSEYMVYQYNEALGYLTKLTDDASPEKTYWSVDKMDAAMRVTEETAGNGVKTTRTFKPQTGRPETSISKLGTTIVQSLQYQFDDVGNLINRNDLKAGTTAEYGYDALNRLMAEIRDGGALTQPEAVLWNYNAVGNMISRSGLGTLTYPTSGATSVRPHAVQSVTGTLHGLQNPQFNYDLNGNLTTVTAPQGQRTLTWNNSNMVESVTSTLNGQSKRLEYLYNADQYRVREKYAVNGVVQRTTYYMHPGESNELIYEEDRSGSLGQTLDKAKFYIKADGRTIGVFTLNGALQRVSTEYWHTDHLGSITAVTNQNGVVAETMAYEPFGKRRHINGLEDASETLTSVTDRGFTGHEMMFEVGLVNMNGRIYDAALSRFLSPDPLVQAPEFMQSYNRYAYTFNNPLKFVDPTGFEAEGMCSAAEMSSGGSYGLGYSNSSASWGSSGGSQNTTTWFSSPEFNNNAIGYSGSNFYYAGSTGRVIGSLRVSMDSSRLGSERDGDWLGLQTFFQNHIDKGVERSGYSPTAMCIGALCTALNQTFIPKSKGDLAMATLTPFRIASKLDKVYDAAKGATNFSRELSAADLGLKGVLKELRGTSSLKEGIATMRVDMIRGEVANPLQVVGNMVEAAKASGAKLLRIEGTIANERLYNVLARRYGLTSNGATDVITIPLK
jgi:RHS repeat-associated protein